jgi:hypothetical protein
MPAALSAHRALEPGRSTPGMLCASQRGGLLPSSADGAQLRRVGLALIENDNTSPSLPWRRSFRRPEDSTAGRLCIPLRESRRLRDTPLTNHSDNHRYRTVQCLATGKPSQRTSAAARVHADCRQRHVYGCSRARRHDLEVHKPRAKQNLVGTCRNRMHLLQADAAGKFHPAVDAGPMCWWWFAGTWRRRRSSFTCCMIGAAPAC